MQVSVETLEGLERKVTVSVPTQQIEEEVKSRLKSLAHKVKIDGFRPGKVPVNIVTQKYSDSVRLEVAKDLIEPTLKQALEDNELNLAGHPSVELQVLEKDKDFKYTASFEVYPTIDIKELNKASVEQIQSEVTDKDVSDMLEKLQNQHADWVEVSTPAKNGNKALIDFEGFLNDELFEGGSAKQHELTLGSATMIPGFEEGIAGKKAGEVFDIQVKFPEDYGHEKLSNKEARFKITLHKVTEPKLPELDDAFAERFNIKEGGIDALKKDIKENMVRELEKRISMLNRETMFNKLLEANPITLPASLVDSEIESLKHDAYHRIFGHEHHDNEKIPDFPRELFEAQAKNRVHLGLIFSEYIKKHNIVVDEERVNVTIEKIASAYESPEELRQLYKTNKRHKSEIHALVMEEIVAEHIGKDATISYVTKGYDAVMNPKGAEEQGE